MSSTKDAPPRDATDLDESFRNLAKPASAEFVGCIFFMFIAVGCAVSTKDFGAYNGPIDLSIALSFGFTVFVIAFTIGHVSGGHLNCAVTLAFVVVKKISWKRGLMYFGAQFIGSILGVALLRWWSPDRFQENCFGANNLGVNVTSMMGFGTEFLCTFLLLFVVSAASDSAKSNSTLVPFAIGSAVTICHLMALGITGCSINPTRSFASVFVSLNSKGNCDDAWSNHWIFWLGPLIGGVCGAVTYDILFATGGGLQNTLLSQYINKAAGPAQVTADPENEEEES